MIQKIFVNLAVKNLKNSIAFFTKLGFTFDPKFTNATATCMIVAENICVMLLEEKLFTTFINKKICNAKSHTEVLVCVQVESRAEVDALVEKAVAAGGKCPRPVQDHGHMYGHGFEDLDHHIWEVVWMGDAPQKAPA